jgi:hypothetical protein
MELKDVILSTLAEMDDVEVKTEIPVKREVLKEVVKESNSDSELLYLNSIKERLLVLFEGFQAPNNTNIEAKVDMTLNFLEYVLATIDNRLELLQKGKKL